MFKRLLPAVAGWFQNASTTSIATATILVFGITYWYCTSFAPSPKPPVSPQQASSASRTLGAGNVADLLSDLTAIRPSNSIERFELPPIDSAEYLNEGCRLTIEQLNTAFSELATSDDGRRIAASPKFASQMLALKGWHEDYVVEYRAVQSRLVEQRLGGQAKNTSNKLADLKSLAERVKALAKAVQAIRSVCAKNQPSEATLFDSWTQQEKGLALNYASAAEARRKAEQDERERLLEIAAASKFKAEQRLLAARQNLETQRKTIAATRLELLNELKFEDDRHKAQKVQLHAEFQRDRAAVEHYLAPLLRHGYSQPERGSHHRSTRVKGPMSVSALMSFGAMFPTEAGLTRLAYAVGSNANDRDQSPFLPFAGGIVASPKHMRILRPAQELLLKYQYILVEQGMLAP